VNEGPESEWLLIKDKRMNNRKIDGCEWEDERMSGRDLHGCERVEDECKRTVITRY